MSIWPIIYVECLKCDRYVFADEYGLDPDDDQQEFLDVLRREGWDVPRDAKSVEAGDDGGLISFCPQCQEHRSN